MKRVSQGTNDAGKKDFFICYAHEDRESARALRAELTKHDRSGSPPKPGPLHPYTVWLDEYEITVGDSLKAEIEKGLLASDFGVVILSKSFFAHPWPQEELAALHARAVSAGRKVILPVLQGINNAFLAAKAPLLAGVLAVDSAKGWPHVGRELIRAYRKARGLPLATRTKKGPTFRIAGRAISPYKSVTHTGMTRAGSKPLNRSYGAFVALGVEKLKSGERSDSQRTVDHKTLRTLSDAALKAAFGTEQREIGPLSGGNGTYGYFLPMGVKWESLYPEFVGGLERRLQEHNHPLREAARIRLRVVFHSGEVEVEHPTPKIGSPYSGEEVDAAFRLLESQALREKLAIQPEGDPVGLMVSDTFYQKIIRPGLQNPNEEFIRCHVQSNRGPLKGRYRVREHRSVLHPNPTKTVTEKRKKNSAASVEPAHIRDLEQTIGSLRRTVAKQEKKIKSLGKLLKQAYATLQEQSKLTYD